MYIKCRKGWLFMSIWQTIASFIVSILSVFSFLVPSGVEYTPKDEAAILLNATVMSDLHAGPLNPILQSNINKALRNASAAKGGNDALVLLGDNTMDGTEIQYATIFSALSLYNEADNLLVAIGNHDVWSGAGFHTEKEKFIKYYNTYSGSEIDNMYYYKVINGYYFIVLGTEADMGTNAFLSNTQISWLDGVLAEATAEGKPAFVFHHFPINRVHEPERLKTVLNSYANVFLFTGHMHHALGANSFTKAGDALYYIDVPGFNGDEDNILNYLGHGFQIEAYAGEVIIRARDYCRGNWLTDYEYTIALV